MQKFIILCMVIVFLVPIVAEVKISIVSDKKVYQANEKITLSVKIEKTELEADADIVWDTYLFFRDSRNMPLYITPEGNKVNPEVLGMLPAEIYLQPKHWKHSDRVSMFVCACLPNTQKVIATAHTTFVIQVAPEAGPMPQLPSGAQLVLIQELSEANDRYSDYKQFDSRWKNITMGSSNGTTIGRSGCAITSAGNLIGKTPDAINKELQSNGGYSGNAIMWNKVSGLSYYGSGSISDSIFSSYHVIGDVGGHFVVLTGISSSGSYNSKDPGKSYNPVYTKSQVYSVRLYRK